MCLALLLVPGCGPDLGSMVGSSSGIEEKDSGWLAADTYEVNGMVTGRVAKATGQLGGATNRR